VVKTKLSLIWSSDAVWRLNSILDIIQGAINPDNYKDI